MTSPNDGVPGCDRSTLQGEREIYWVMKEEDKYQKMWRKKLTDKCKVYDNRQNT